MYGQKIRKRQDYTMDTGTMIADDSHSPGKHITDEHRYMKLYPLLYDGCKKGFQKGMRSGNYHSVLTGRTSTAFNQALKQGATTDCPFDGHRIPAKVCRTPCYLTPEERNAIYEMDLLDATTPASYRDLFMFLYLVVCRYSDLARLTSDNIVSGGVEYIPHKTREKNPGTVRVSHNEKSRTILERLQGCQRTRTLAARNSCSRFSTVARKLLTLAGITCDIPVHNTEEVQGNHETDQRNRKQPHGKTGVHRQSLQAGERPRTRRPDVRSRGGKPCLCKILHDR